MFGSAYERNRISPLDDHGDRLDEVGGRRFCDLLLNQEILS